MARNSVKMTIKNKHSRPVFRAGYSFPADRTVTVYVNKESLPELQACIYLKVEKAGKDDEVSLVSGGVAPDTEGLVHAGPGYTPPVPSEAGAHTPEERDEQAVNAGEEDEHERYENKPSDDKSVDASGPHEDKQSVAEARAHIGEKEQVDADTLRHNEKVDADAEENEPWYTEAELKKIKKAELKDIARELDIPVSQTADELREAILNYEETAEDDEDED